MVLLRVVHPPAGATTMIVALGFITRSVDLAVVEASIVVLTVEALVINRPALLCRNAHADPAADADSKQ